MVAYTTWELALQALFLSIITLHCNFPRLLVYFLIVNIRKIITRFVNFTNRLIDFRASEIDIHELFINFVYLTISKNII